MKIEEIYERAIGLMSHPEEEWPVIREETENARQTLVGYVIPFSLLIAALSLFGLVMFGAGTNTPAGIFNLVLTVLFSFFSPLLLLFNLYFIAWYLGAAMGSDARPGHYLVWFGHAFTPLYLVDAFSSLHWTFSWMMIFGLYSVYLIWSGIPVMTGITGSRRISFFVMVLLIAGLLYTFYYWLLPVMLLR